MSVGSRKLDALATSLQKTAPATALSAKVRSLVFASLVDEAYGGKCDAVELVGSIAANSTTYTVSGGHGLTVGAGSPDIGKSFFLPKAGVARDGIAMATYVSSTTATLEKPVQFALSGADCGFMQSSWNSTTGNYDASHVKRTATVTVAAGGTALTDTGAGIISGGSLAYWLPGAFAETLVATISAVPSSTTITISVAATVAVSGGTALVGTDDTAALAAALTALEGFGSGKGVELRIPRSTILRPNLLSDGIKISAGPNAKIWGIFNANNTAEKLFEVTGDDVELQGLRINGSYSPVLVANSKYVIQASGNDTIIHKCRITNFRSDDTNPAGGISGINSGAVQILPVHGIYLTGAGQEVMRCRIDNMSGAGVFTSNATGFTVERNFIGLTLWYSFTADRGADDGWSFSHNRMYTTHTLARHWGGIINLMSQIGGARNKNGKVIGNTIRGTCDYGAALRVLSLEDVEIAHNTIRDIIPGAYTGGPVQYIGMDTRTLASVGDSGPCKRVNLRDNPLVATGKNQIATYIKISQGDVRVARDAMEDIWVWNNTIKSPDASNYFDMGISVSAGTGGGDRTRVWNNYIEVITRDAAVLSAAASITGAMSFLGGSAQGALDDTQEWNNILVDLGTKNAGGNINNSRQAGYTLIQYVTNFRAKGGTRVKNFHVGVRLADGSTSPVVAGFSTIEGLTKLNIRCESCDTDFNLAGGPWETTRTAVAVTWTNVHIGKTVKYTAGSFTQAPPALGLLGDGGWVKLKNASVNPITISMAGGNQTFAAGQVGYFSEDDGEVTFVAGNYAA